MPVKTFQSGIRNHKDDKLTEYALFAGGLNVTRNALNQYDPLRGGFVRVFMTRVPAFLDALCKTDPIFSSKLKKFKHIIEYAHTSVDGMDDITLTTNNMTGGYAGRSVELPNIATDSASDLSIKVYELGGSPVREMLQMWISGMSDINSGLATYHQTLDPNHENYLERKQSNQTAEIVVVNTDSSGLDVENVALFANVFPKSIPFSHFNYESGTHSLAEININFAATRYMSPLINDLGKTLLTKYNILMNSLNFHHGYASEDDVYKSNGSYYDINSGKLIEKAKEQSNTIIHT